MYIKKTLGVSVLILALSVRAIFPCLHAAAAQAISENALRYPVLVTLDTGSTASGFYLNVEHKHLYFVTAKHVLFRYTKDQLALKSDKADLLSYPAPVSLEDPVRLELDLKVLLENGNIKAHPEKDVAVIKITGTRKSPMSVDLAEGVIKKDGFQGSLLSAGLENIKTFENILPSNEVFIFGYPTSLGIKSHMQIDPNKPLLRKGIIAGKNDINRTIILDCPSYYGNSGGPCIEVEQIDPLNRDFHLIGVVIEFVPFEEQWVNIRHGLMNSEFENSGYSVVEPIDSVLELIRS